MKFQTMAHKFFANKRGEPVIWQWPNTLLWIWIALKVFILIVSDESLKTHVGNLSAAILFTWAYLEISEGESLFRRILGTLVAIVVIIGFFK